MKLRLLIFPLIFLVLVSCDKKDQPLFTPLNEGSGLDFNNTLTYTEEFNPYTYRNFFNGAGVALGDVNNDGLLDIYFTGNMVDNKLFLNKGNLQFEDISESAGVHCPGVWSSGATFVDVNGDGWLDLYVCKSGKPEGDNRNNELFINNGDLTFSEQSKAYNLDIEGLSTHAAFFDYDKDGDLDVYILTNSGRSVGVGFDLVEGQREIPDATNGGNKFLRNDGGVFTDITLEADIYASEIGFGLGITLGDFNNDNWTDIFVSNDFFEKDYLYINDTEGGFIESGEDYFESMSMGSMGADMADLNNDGYQELMVTEMLPSTLDRQRTKTMYENWNKYQIGVSKGYYHQFSRNVLQRNTGKEQFLEISRFAGVAASEWSWGALMFDMDNDGLRDIFVSNGIAKDLLDRDYLNFMANGDQIRSMIKENKNVIEELLSKIPSGPVSNAAFLNQGGFKFKEAAIPLGLGKPTFSSGSAYGDLDNDGDLDLVLNNINGPSQVLINQSNNFENSSIRLRLMGSAQNTNAIGAQVTAWAGDQQYYAENFPSRGFQSSMDPILHMGLGKAATVDSLIIQWPNDQITKVYNVKANMLHAYQQEEAVYADLIQGSQITSWQKSIIDDMLPHGENSHNDFDREPLLAEMYNNLGPALSAADINSDGATDLFIGGAKNSAGQLLIKSANGYTSYPVEDFDKNAGSEDVASLFVDVDGDGDQDLFVCSGGRAFSKNSTLLSDRLYMNDGNGNFKHHPEKLPVTSIYSSSCVASSDVDNDGDIDLFVGERFHPFYYAQGGNAHLLINDGRGNYSEKDLGLGDIGMITDAVWADLNADGQEDLVIVGDWMGIKVFLNDSGELKNATSSYLRSPIGGLWNAIIRTDLDGDGDTDFVVGNHGTNSFLKEGLRMYHNDFDRNGTMDHIICHKIGDRYYPIADKDELMAQLPSLRKKIFYYKDYADAAIDDLFEPAIIAEASIYDAHTMQSIILLNEGDQLKPIPLPSEAQYTSIHAIAAADLNGDEFVDLVLAGNQYLVKPQFGRYDGLNGIMLYGSKDGFSSDRLEFLKVRGQVRGITIIEDEGKKNIVFAKNGEKAEIYE